VLLAIGVFKLVKAALLVALAAGALKFANPATTDALRHWARASGVAASHESIRRALASVLSADEATLVEIGAVSLLYAALFATEGVGLCLRKTWAEYLTAIMTASLVPLEVYELWRGVTVPKLVVTLVNVAVLAYLIWVLRRAAADKRQTAGGRKQ
jgi:uncharacterized membrane protein (DUF2068 family)